MRWASMRDLLLNGRMLSGEKDFKDSTMHVHAAAAHPARPSPDRSHPARPPGLRGAGAQDPPLRAGPPRGEPPAGHGPDQEHSLDPLRARAARGAAAAAEGAG